ncbi:MAG: AMP-binding protein, partial [Deltaproteobacteria bacterium]|nr:AMP-binding protein [Deltaproteobacteria bacterium]
MHAPATVGQHLLDLYGRRPRGVAVLRRQGPRIAEMSWQELLERGAAAGAALRELGVRAGGTVGIVATPRPDYLSVLCGIWLSGAVAVPIHHTCTGQEIESIARSTGLQVLVVSGPTQLRKLTVPGRTVPVQLVLLEDSEILDTMDERGRSFLRLRDLAEERIPANLRLLGDLVGEGRTPPRAEPRGEPGAPAVIIHTPGTSGDYKGVVLSHGALLHQGREIARMLGLTDADVELQVLPFSHVLGLVSLMACTASGAAMAFGGGFRSLVEDLGVFQPSFVVGVPRMYEKLVRKIQAGTEEFGILWRTAFRKGLEASRERLERRLVEEPVDWIADLQHGLADRLVFPRVRALFGGRLRFFVSGGAPLDREVGVYISALGVPVYEGYGLTETGGASHLNAPGRFRPGTVGRALDGVETRIEEDGEILVRSLSSMQGYLGDPAGTGDMLDGEGWLRTGDIGHLDPEGYLTVSGRKKELLVTAVGKNVAPQKIE